MTNTIATTTTTSMQTVILKVGLHCEGCERRVKKALFNVKGTASVDVDKNREWIKVTGFVDPSKLLKAVKKTGKPVELWNYPNGNGNKNLYGSQPVMTTPSKASKGGPKGNNGNKSFQGSNKSNEHDRSFHPQPEYLSEASDYEHSPKMQFYGKDGGKSDLYGDFKSPKNQMSDFYSDLKPQKSQKTDYFGDLKPQKNQKSDFYGDLKPQKNQNSGGYGDFKSPKSQKSSDFHTDAKPQKNQKNQKSDSFFGSFKSSKNQKSDFYSDAKPQKNQQKSDFYDDIKPQKNQQKSDFYGDAKPQKNQHMSDFYGDVKPQKHQQKSDFYGDFKSPKNEKFDHYGEFKSPKSQKSEGFKSEKKANYKVDTRSEYDDLSHSGSEDDSDFSDSVKKPNIRSGYDDENSTGLYGNHHKQSGHEFKKSGYGASTYNNEHKSSGSTYSNEHNKSPYMDTSRFDGDRKSNSNQKKQKSQVAPKYVSFEDDYEQPRYRQQPEGNYRNQDRGHEQKFYTTEQSYHPGYSYAYHDRVPPANTGFSTMFSEENPNACSIM
ncbi:uncharacterized protein LOC112345095 [Selaginella moellendorffii]|uniref:uncharacterized protein LOC112345095 n=1 Tax=Selaginella moellendorffii TaxID=88036 RepID=UPI000D1C50CD|nr:uncharacterized protein LOC112345095 [Selaginella moellendorffii]|eukprot:XP_024526904.1 uncharacterized protein LOC112345095 [Selaginella moellendorffii]